MRKEKSRTSTKKMKIAVATFILVAALFPIYGCAPIQEKLIDAEISQVISLQNSGSNGFAVELIIKNYEQSSKYIVSELYKYDDYYKKLKSQQDNNNKPTPIEVIDIEIPKKSIIQQDGSATSLLDITVSKEINPGKYFFIIRTKTDYWKTNPFSVQQTPHTITTTEPKSPAIKK